jgi:homoserine O-succinyltransferase/O-acetyltransferase
MPVLTMPVRPSESGALPRADELATAPVRPQETNAQRLVVGLLNNMPDAAVDATERQFLDLLSAAAGDIPVQLRLFSLPDVPRSEAVRRQMRGRYCGIDDLWDSRLDALIVTGTEPRAPCLTDEPYWGALTRVLEWAQDNTISSVWSCLAAHAAVLHMDGIARHPLEEKRFGIFECMRVSHHALLTGVAAGIRIAHSRWNDLPEQALTACNYTILTRSSEAGVDAFVKQRKSLFVFFQGHPEYDRRALLREYRRDVGRFLRGERATYPATPKGYFNPVAADALARFRERAVCDRRDSLIESFPISFLESRLSPVPGSSASRIYENWLSYLCAQKDQPGDIERKPAPGVLRAGAPQPAQDVR